MWPVEVSTGPIAALGAVDHGVARHTAWLGLDGVA
jgi:hypothetical protein